MTSENRRFVSLDEILSIRYECRNCGTSVTVPRQKWGDKIQRQCPHCVSDPPAAWVAVNSHEQTALIELQRSIGNLVASKAMNCRIQLEIRDSKSESKRQDMSAEND